MGCSRRSLAADVTNADSEFGASFSDFPGAVTAGTSLENARAMAEEALALHINGLVADEEATPEPSSLDAVMADPGNIEGVPILVVHKAEAKKIGPRKGHIDPFAEAHGLTRSWFLAKAAKREMELAAA
ncbi:type II toxin-antitoxin system HicB family antitoxin [Ensifer adhaerens]|uniref:type II toxin-antitoxin system HicB family antitoxin n=1 Tax=Ensifer adhaerens TaxID=106592 RepID=UPI00132E90B4|nr:type II toxin-antitoxin system HicB family antitoxin [Ensifer adhaerens]QHG73003.1 CopG family transcriptional regulator [Ensifer adhaerens]